VASQVAHVIEKLVTSRQEASKILAIQEGFKKWPYCYRRRCEATLRKVTSLNVKGFVTGLVDLLNDRICADSNDFDDVLDGLNLLESRELFESFYAQKLL
jgi:hypothetical protein